MCTIPNTPRKEMTPNGKPAGRGMPHRDPGVAVKSARRMPHRDPGAAMKSALATAVLFLGATVSQVDGQSCDAVYSTAETCHENPFAKQCYPAHLTLERTSYTSDYKTPFCDYDDGYGAVYTTTDRMDDKCNAFCGQHSDVSIPVLIGSAHFGLNFKTSAELLAHLNDPTVANSLKQVGSSSYEQCIENRNAFHSIKGYGVKLVEQLLEFDAVVLVYGETIRDTIDDLTRKLDSKETNDKIQHATGHAETIEVIVGLYQETISGGKTTSARVDMDQKLKQLWGAFDTLHFHLGPELEKAEAFVSQCATKKWPVSDGPVLLDICTRKGTKCINREHAEHVSCGCLVNLAPGVGTKVTPKTSSGGRRLSEAAEKSGSIDICAAAANAAKPYLEKMKAQASNKELFTDHKRQLADEYGSFYCSDAERRRVQSYGSKGHEVPEPAPGPPPVCQTNPFKEEFYPDFFSLARENHEPNFCNYQEEKEYPTTGSMIKKCAMFCGKNAIPALLGSEQFGLSFTQATGALAKIMNPKVDDSLKSMKRSEYKQCLEDRNAFYVINRKGAVFIKALYEFDAAVLLYRAATLDAAKHARAELVSDKIRDAVQHATGQQAKMKVILEMYAKVMASSESAAQAEIAKKLNELKQATLEFKQNLDSEMVKARRFVNSPTCSAVWPPADGAALLDICTTTGTKCINVQDAQHVSCGCLVNLAADVGSYTNPNIVASGRRLESDSSTDDLGSTMRRLQSGASVFDMCAEARKAASPYISDVGDRLKDKGHAALIKTANKEMSGRYGSAYCSVWSKEFQHTPTPAPPQIGVAPVPGDDGGNGNGAIIGVIMASVVLVLGGCFYRCFYNYKLRQPSGNTCTKDVENPCRPKLRKAKQDAARAAEAVAAAERARHETAPHVTAAEPTSLRPLARQAGRRDMYQWGRSVDMSSVGSLPQGWERTQAPDGRIYYVDHNTQQTHWQLPAVLLRLM